MANAVNKIRAIDNALGECFISSKNIKREFFRMAHLQFPWQDSNINQVELSRYFYIYDHESVKGYFEDFYKIEIKKFYIAILVMFATLIDRPAIKLPITNFQNTIAEEEFVNILGHISLPIEKYGNLISQQRQINESFFHSFSPVQKYPLVRTLYRNDDCVVCPSLFLFIKRITAGIYYDLIDHYGIGKFGNAFGKSYEHHIGQILSKANIKGEFTQIDDSQDRCDNTVDWIYHDNKTALFIECKTQRVPLFAKQELNQSNSREEFINKIVGHIVQVYGAINRYLQRSYPKFPFKAEIRNLHPIVVSLESWYLFGVNRDELKLDDRVEKALADNGIPESFLTKFPYSLMSSNELEQVAQVIQEVDINVLFSGKHSDPDKRDWTFGSYLSGSYGEERRKCKSLFNFFEEFEYLRKVGQPEEV